MRCQRRLDSKKTGIGSHFEGSYKSIPRCGNLGQLKTQEGKVEMFGREWNCAVMETADTLRLTYKNLQSRYV